MAHLRLVAEDYDNPTYYRGDNTVSSRGKKLLGSGALLLTAGLAFAGYKAGASFNDGTAEEVLRARLELFEAGRDFVATGGNAGSCENIALRGMLISSRAVLKPVDIEIGLTLSCGPGDHIDMSRKAAAKWQEVDDAKAGVTKAVQDTEYDDFEKFEYSFAAALGGTVSLLAAFGTVMYLTGEH